MPILMLDKNPIEQLYEVRTSSVSLQNNGGVTPPCKDPTEDAKERPSPVILQDHG
jgi:hypothetical protein